jgi:hypothetical protein
MMHVFFKQIKGCMWQVGLVGLAVFIFFLHTRVQLH